MAWRATDVKRAADAVEPFLNSEKPEVSLGRSGAVIRIKSAAVVPDVDFQSRRRRFAADVDLRCLAVTDGVDDELSDDAEKGVERRVGDVRPLEVEFHIG